MARDPETPGPLELLILQPTPFCNINCSYCYLPDRQNTRRMSVTTLDQVYRWVFASGLARQRFTLLWHAGEPLVLPVAFYEDALARLAVHNTASVPVDHSFQTNATLLTPEWCDFAARHNVHLGVSVDGPAFLHDRHRRTRQGQGTLHKTLAGMRLLRERGVRYYVITVLTDVALDYPDELYDFYRAEGVHHVGFNIEEVEGPHTSSSLQGEGKQERFRRFFDRFCRLVCAGDYPLEVRELDDCGRSLLQPPFGPGSRNQENKPWAIVSVDCDGNFGTYSPELLGLTSEHYGAFALGNVATHTVADVTATAAYQRMEEDIGRGVRACREACDYFPYCGGGAPANKYFENGTFDSTETMFCRLHRQVCVDVAVGVLQRRPPCPPEEDAPAEPPREAAPAACP